METIVKPVQNSRGRKRRWSADPLNFWTACFSLLTIHLEQEQSEDSSHQFGGRRHFPVA